MVAPGHYRPELTLQPRREELDRSPWAASIAATVDIVSDGRLDFGIGAGSRPSMLIARREYDAQGMSYLDAPGAVDSLTEACTVIDRPWTETEPFDLAGTHHRLTGALCNPKPPQKPRPPFVLGGRSKATLRIVAEHADIWNYPGDDIDDALARRPCSTASAATSTATRPKSPATPCCRSPDDLAATRTTLTRAMDAGFPHLVLSLPAPYPDRVAHWVADELTTTTRPS